MIRLILGLKGSGKTKKLIDFVNISTNDEPGDIVCIERKLSLIHDLPRTVRLINCSDYDFDGYDFFKGFISGIHSANYDITHIFIDNILDIIKRKFDNETEEFLDWCDNFHKKNSVKFTITLNIDENSATDRIRKYLS